MANRIPYRESTAKAKSLGRDRFDLRTLVAYHEAGHAILSLAINEAPRHVSIRAQGDTWGRTVQEMRSGPTVLAQVYLAGFAAEHILVGRRARQLDREVGFALLTMRDPDLASAFSGSDERDGYRAVQAVLSTGLLSSDQVASEIERLYAVARGSLVAVWPAVGAVAKALMEREQVDAEELLQAVRGNEVFAPVRAVQEAHGLRSALSADSREHTRQRRLGA